MADKRSDARRVVLEALSRFAPEVEGAALDLDAPLRDQVDLDSMDFLNFIVAIHERLGVDIPEADYARLSSINAIVDYVTTRGASEPG